MAEEQRHWILLGQRYRDFDNLRLTGSMFRDQQGVFGWHLGWFDIQQYRLVDEQYWFDKGDFFEAVWLDHDGHWKCRRKRTKGAAYKEMCMREAMTIWESEQRESSQ
jgi:hypothetical protein